MKIVYVGDNRNRGNFGCRATSTALSQLISINNQIVGVVSGKYTNSDNGQLFFYQHYPKWIYRKLGKFKYWNDLKTGLYLFARLIKGHHYYFSNFDFISYDLDKSIENLIRCIPANPGLAEMDLRQYDFDALVVNGEGSFIFATPPWRECLVETMLMHWALKMGKKVYYLNGMLSDDPYTERNNKTIDLVKSVFSKVQVVQIREYESLEYAKQHFTDSNIVIRPDALFSWYDYINDSQPVVNGRYFIGPSGANDASFFVYDFSKPYICIAGSSSAGLASRSCEQVVKTYLNLVNLVRNAFDMDIYLVEVCEGDHFLRDVSRGTGVPLIPIDTPILAAAKILANARAFISGRYHPAILASLGGTPCVFMSSNSHKTHSLQVLLEYENVIEHPVLPTNDDCEKIIAEVKEKLFKGNELRQKIKSCAYRLSVEAKTIADIVK